MSSESSGAKPPNPNEGIKTASRFLRGTLAEDMADVSSGAISETNGQLTKFHGLYLQDAWFKRDPKEPWLQVLGDARQARGRVGRSGQHLDAVVRHDHRAEASAERQTAHVGGDQQRPSSRSSGGLGRGQHDRVDVEADDLDAGLGEREGDPPRPAPGVL